MTLQSLLELIRCPRCKSVLVRDGDWLVSIDPECRLKYEIKDQIPVMIPEEAVELTVEEWGAIMERNGRNSATGVLATP